MASRVYYSNSSTTTDTNASSTYTDKVTITFTPTSGKRYAIFWQATVNNTSTTVDSRVRLQDTTNGTTYQEFNIESKDTTDNIMVNDVALFEAPNGNSITFAVQWASETTTTVSIYDSYMTIIQLFDDEPSYTSGDDLFTTSNTTYTAATSTAGTDEVTVTQGDWFIITSAAMNTPNTSQDPTSIGIRIYNTETENFFMERFAFYSKDTTNYTPYWAAVDVPSTTGTTYQLQIKVVQAGLSSNFGVNYRTIIALKKGNFAETFSATDESSSTTTSATYQTKLNISPTINYNTDYLLLATWVTDHGSTSTSVKSEINDGSPINSADIFREPSDVDDRFQQGWAMTTALTSGTYSYDINYGTESAGQIAQIINTGFVILNLGSLVLETQQEAFLWRDDDGSESAASSLASQDVSITRQTSTPTRIRILTNTIDVASSKQLTLQYKRTDEPESQWRDV